MVNKIQRRTKPVSKEKTAQRDSLLSAVLANPVDMAPCSFCESRKLECKLSENDSSRCSSCIRYNQANCDVKGLSPEQLQRVAAQHRRLELELEAAEEEADQVNARLRRLRKQKRMWYEKMMKAVTRGIDNLKELERLEREEAGEQDEGPVTGTQSSDRVDWSTVDAVPDDFNWDAVFDPVVAGESSSGGAGRS
ncbi:hypothetical protein DL771_009554 [Monosporascus sp. 5C6A]|nr:hypothetical protein DL771_009554 [Monosporascus sp. 5C6A]